MLYFFIFLLILIRFFFFSKSKSDYKITKRDVEIQNELLSNIKENHLNKIIENELSGLGVKLPQDKNL